MDKQTGWKHHEWGVVAQTPQHLHDSEPYIEVAYCELCEKYQIYGDGKPARITKVRPELPNSYWL